MSNKGPRVPHFESPDQFYELGPGGDVLPPESATHVELLNRFVALSELKRMHPTMVGGTALAGATDAQISSAELQASVDRHPARRQPTAADRAMPADTAVGMPDSLRGKVEELRSRPSVSLMPGNPVNPGRNALVMQEPSRLPRHLR